jgi:hypothetical protein
VAGQTELEEALAASQVGALIPKAIDPVILEYVRRYAPMARALPTVPWHTNQYYWNTRTVLPPGGFVTDGGARPVGNSTYVQSHFDIKLLQAIGAVTGFAQVVTADLVGSLKQREVEGTLMGLAFDLENALCWGNCAATVGGWAPQFDGFDAQINVFSGATQNAVDRAGATFALADLDPQDLVPGGAPAGHGDRDQDGADHGRLADGLEHLQVPGRTRHRPLRRDRGLRRGLPGHRYTRRHEHHHPGVQHSDRPRRCTAHPVQGLPDRRRRRDRD